MIRTVIFTFLFLFVAKCGLSQSVPNEIFVYVQDNSNFNEINVSLTRLIQKGEEDSVYFTAWHVRSDTLTRITDEIGDSSYAFELTDQTSLSFETLGWSHMGVPPHTSETFAWGKYKLTAYFDDEGSPVRDSIFVDFTDQNYEHLGVYGDHDMQIRYRVGFQRFEYGTSHLLEGDSIPNGRTVGIWEWDDFRTREVFKFHPNRPLNFEISTGSNDHPLLSWHGSLESFPVKYEVYRNKNGSAFSKVATVTDTTYLDDDFVITTSGFSYDVCYYGTLNAAQDTNLQIYRSSEPTDTLCVDALHAPAPPKQLSEDAFTEKHVTHGNYPNPFNSSTVVRFSISKPASVTLTIVNMLGSIVQRSQAKHSAGSHNTLWEGTGKDGRNLSSGIYFYVLEFDFLDGERLSRTGKMLLIK